MLIILEGVDCSGKSTLANELVSLIGDAELIHRGVPIDHVLDEYELALLNYVPQQSRSIVCDRWHIGPDVYGPIKRGDNGLDPVIRWHINAFLQAKGAYLVYTEMPLDALLSRMNERGEDYLARDEVASVIDLYREVIQKTPLHFMSSVTGFHDAHGVITAALAPEASSSQCGAFTSYVGTRRPSRLIVGDSPTPIAFMPYEGTHNYDIVKRYALGGDTDTAFVNYTEQLNELWDAIYNPLVIAIDQKSADACHHAHIPFAYKMEDK